MSIEQGIFGRLCDREIERADTNSASLAASLGWPPSTVYGYREQRKSPTIQAVYSARDLISDQMMLELLQLLGGVRFAIAIVPHGERPRNVTAQTLLGAAIRLGGAAHEIEQTVHDALRDGRIDNDERAAIVAGAARVTQLDQELIANSQACVGRA